MWIIRAVIHKHIQQEDIDQAIIIIKNVLLEGKTVRNLN